MNIGEDAIAIAAEAACRTVRAKTWDDTVDATDMVTWLSTRRCVRESVNEAVREALRGQV